MGQGVHCFSLWGNEQIERSTVGLSARIVFGNSLGAKMNSSSALLRWSNKHWELLFDALLHLYHQNQKKCIWSNVSLKKKQGFFGMHPLNLRTCKIMSFKAGISSSRWNFQGRPSRNMMPPRPLQHPRGCLGCIWHVCEDLVQESTLGSAFFFFNGIYHFPHKLLADGSRKAVVLLSGKK